MSAERLAGAALAARILCSACVASETSVRSLAFALGLESHAPVGLWRNEEHESSMTIRDLLAVRRQLPRLYAEVVRQLSEESHEAPPSRLCPSRHVVLLVSALGRVGDDVASALADGHIDADELESIAGALAKLAERLRRAQADVNPEGQGR